MLYFIVFFIFSIFAYISPHKNNRYILISVILIVLAFFRFGSGTDYFHYFDLFLITPGKIESISDSLMFIRVEPLFLVLTIMAKKIGLDFPLFASLISLFTLLIFLKMIKKNSLLPFLSMLMFLGLFYLIYIESAIRQGLAMALFFYGYYTFFKADNLKMYNICIVIAVLFHYSAIILFFIPLLKHVKFKNIINPMILFPLIIILFFVSFFFYRFLFFIVGFVFNRYNSYDSQNIHILAVLLRVFNLIIIIYLLSKTKDLLSDFDKLSIKIYIFGILFYFLVSQVSILSRLTEYFSLLEIIIIPNLIFKIKGKETKNLFKILIIIMSLFLFNKDLLSNQVLGEYKERNPLKYPYVNVFQKEEIKNYRQIKYKSEYFNRN